MAGESFEIFKTGIKGAALKDLISLIDSSVVNNSKTTLTYVTAHSLNTIYENDNSLLYNSFSVVFPDGTGTHLALKILYGKKYDNIKMTGTDLLPLILSLSSEKKYKVLLFGENENTINKAAVKIKEHYPLVNLRFVDGFKTSNLDVVKKADEFSPDILVVLTGSPKQEEFVNENLSTLNAKCIVCLGAALKVFSGEKIRGPKFVWLLGLEWVLRLVTEPSTWRRYILGIPKFVFRVVKQKFTID